MSALPDLPPAPGYLAHLNAAQREAVAHGDTPLLIIAGAGSGKTNTLAHRVAHLIVNGADPGKLLLLTFSRRAAVEMTRRVERILARVEGLPSDAARAALAWSGTFHSIGARLLREHAERIGLAPAFTIADREDAADLMNLVRHERGLSAKEKRFPTKNTCLAIYSRVVNTQGALERVLAEAFPWCQEWEADLRTLFAAYVEAKQSQQVLDYDDLLLYWAHMMAEPALAEDVGARFAHVLVDEYQDTNRLQAAILLGMKPDGRGLTVVGDDAQSIYAFRGATVRNILDFPAQFEPPAALVTLDRNYRSTQPILEAANAVIGLASERFTKNLWTEKAGTRRPRLVTVPGEEEQARYVAEEILERREGGTRLKSQAVLFRTSSHSARLEIELTRRNIPFLKFGGLKFLEAAHVKDLLAALRWVENPRDRVAGFRVLQLLPGLGPKTAARILDQLGTGADVPAVLEAVSTPTLDLDAWQGFVATVKQLRGRSPWPAEMEALRRWYQPRMEEAYEDAVVRAEDLLQMERIAATYASRERFLTELTLDPPEATSAESADPLLDEDYLILSTIHSAKGQEWQSVYLLNTVDGCIPSDLGVGSTEETEEERRLLYVAMTRAKEELDLLVPQRFYVKQQASFGDAHLYANRTRFIPAELLPHFEARTWPPPPALPRRTVAGSQASVDLKAKLRAMWG